MRAKGEVSESISSVSQSIEAEMHEGAMVDATLPREPSKGESSSDLPAGLVLGKDNRRLGVWTKIEQPPGTTKEQKMELDTDSITAEKERTTQPPKTEETPMLWESPNDWGPNEWLGDLNYHGWLTNGWGGIYTNNSE